jgi:hemerythrin-like domain-containing protein
MKRATDDLRNEHKIIKRLRNIAKRCSDEIYAGHDIPFDDIKMVIVVIEEFKDRGHHGKEECAYFPSVKGKETSMDEGARALIIEHELGRRIARCIDESFARYKEDKSVREPLARFLKAYVDFLDVHTTREEKFFERIDETVQVSEQVEHDVLEKFEKLEEEKIGRGRHHELMGYVENLEKKPLMNE